MTNITLKAADLKTLKATLSTMEKREWFDILPQVSKIMGDRATTLAEAQVWVKETLEIEPTTAQGRVVAYALALGKKTPAAVAAAQAELEAKTVRASWSTILGAAIKFMDTGLDLEKAMDNVRTQYAPKPEYLTAHNKVASLTEQLEKALKDLRKVAKESGEEFDPTMLEAFANWQTVSPAKRKS